MQPVCKKHMQVVSCQPPSSTHSARHPTSFGAVSADCELTSSIRRYCTGSRHSSTLGRFLRVSRRVSASISGGCLSAMAFRNRATFSSFSIICASTCIKEQKRVSLNSNCKIFSSSLLNSETFFSLTIVHVQGKLYFILRWRWQSTAPTLFRWSSSFPLVSLVSAIRLAKAKLVASVCLRMSLVVCCRIPSMAERRLVEFIRSRSAFSILALEKSFHSSGDVELSSAMFSLDNYVLVGENNNKNKFFNSAILRFKIGLINWKQTWKQIPNIKILTQRH